MAGYNQDTGGSNDETSYGCNPPCQMGEMCKGGACVPAGGNPYGLPPPQGAGPQNCQPKNGVPMKWSPARQQCVFDCPPGSGYEPDKQGCQPCPPGTSPSEKGKCLPGLNGGGGGGGGQGGGGGAGGGMPFGNSMSLLGLGGDKAGFIWDELVKGMQGPFTPELLAGMEGQAAGARESAINRAQMDVNENAIDRGMFGAGSTQRGLLDARMQGEQQFSTQLTQLRTTAAMQNYQAKMAALDKMQKWLGDLRDYAAKLDQTQASREAAAAGIALGYAQIEAQKEMLGTQMGLEWAKFDYTKQQNTICIGGICMPWNQFYGTYGG